MHVFERVRLDERTELVGVGRAHSLDKDRAELLATVPAELRAKAPPRLSVELAAALLERIEAPEG